MDEVTVKCHLYAEDQIVLAPSAYGLQEMVNNINDFDNEFVKKSGMKVNASKTKVMVFERDESTTECDIQIKGEKFKQVKEFVYLGSLFTNYGKHDNDIERKVNEGNKVNGALLTIMNSKCVSR
ncbi:hypothetical protein EVAR_60338_1 [Eumeta japonica]|uniref:Reverse transcriptase domain-containing protein n=1 Tax=Eumeta variegata TaxID=151549 RepID=A0A4C1Z9Q9_EUMVA|nr:hypothetical protein EVAR_60338_1 [Eumeta japonica]